MYFLVGIYVDQIREGYIICKGEGVDVSALVNLRATWGKREEGQGAKKTYHSGRSPHELGRQVASELGTDGTRVSMGASDLAPNHADLGALDILLGPVNVSNALSEVKVRVLLAVDVLNLDKTCVFALVALCALVAEDLGLRVESAGSGEGRRLVRVGHVPKCHIPAPVCLNWSMDGSFGWVGQRAAATPPSTRLRSTHPSAAGPGSRGKRHRRWSTNL